MANPSDVFSILNKDPEINKQKFAEKKINKNIYRKGKVI